MIDKETFFEICAAVGAFIACVAIVKIALSVGAAWGAQFTG